MMRRLMLNFVLICIFLVLGSAQSWASGSGKLGLQHLEFGLENILVVGPKDPSFEISGQVEANLKLRGSLYLHSGVGIFINLAREREYGFELNNSFEVEFAHHTYFGFLASLVYPFGSRKLEGMFGPLVRFKTPGLEPIHVRTVAFMFLYKAPLFEGEEGDPRAERAIPHGGAYGLVTQIAFW
jgi:hypothetical protein